MRRSDVEAAARHAVVGGAVAGLAAAVGGRVGPRTGVSAAAGVLGALTGAVLWAERSALVRGQRLQRQVRKIEEPLRYTDARLGAIAREVRELHAGVAGIEDRARRASQQAEQEARRRADALVAEVRRVEGRLARDVDTGWSQTEALLNLHALLRPRAAMPASRRWAASPDLLLTYVSEVLASPDGSTVVECGSGTSTLWAAYALEVRGGDGKVVALEHDEQFRDHTVAALARHGLTGRAEVRHAPIEPIVLDGWREQPWYATSALEDIKDIGVLFVDGPIGSLHERSRYPALPLLRERLLPGAAVLLDDAGRPEEKAVLAAWVKENPDLELVALQVEKGAALLRTPDDAA